MGLLKFDEPFTRLLTQGMVLNHIYYRRNPKGGIDYIAPDDVSVTHDAAGRVTGARLESDGSPVEYDGVGTMSKSKLNGVDPQDIIERYGADAARLFVMFASPPEQTMEWSDAGVEGMYRFLRRLWTYAQNRADALARAATPIDWSHAPESLRAVRRELHLHLKQADNSYQRVQYNTVVSAAMKMLNALEAAPSDATSASAELAREGLSLLLRVLNPAAPHITHVLWEDLGYAARMGDIVDAPWPRVDPGALAQKEIELVLQVNGKLRGKLIVAADADRGAIEAAALASAPVRKVLEETGGSADPAASGSTKVIVVPNRLVNVVLPRKSA